MKKIKYIIIFTLLLALALIYKQLIDYKDIANTLLSEVNNLDKQTKILKQQTEEQSNKIIELEQTHIEQEDYITTLKNEMILMHINANELNTTDDTNDSNQSYFDLNDTNQIYTNNYEENSYQDIQTDELNENEINETLTDETELNNSSQNAITGYGLEHME